MKTVVLVILFGLLIGAALRAGSVVPARRGAGWRFVAQGSKPAAAEYPAVTLDNGVVKAKVYLPDAKKGYYRGSRFDWSGMVRQVHWNGHTFFGELKGSHNPKKHDHAAGPVEEFGMDKPLGYDEAKPGESFIKIGVGHLLKSGKGPYRFHKSYKIQKAGDWTVEKTKDSISFTQELKDDRGWGYLYTKTVKLTGEPAGLVLERTLKNIGAKAIETNFYNHNMIIIDGRKIGPEYRFVSAADLTIPDNLKAKWAKRGATIGAREITFDKTVSGALWAKVEGREGKTFKDVKVINKDAGVGVQLSCSAPLSKFNIYIEKTALCPEPFHRFNIEPGKEVKWSSSYTFFETKK